MFGSIRANAVFNQTENIFKNNKKGENEIMSKFYSTKNYEEIKNFMDEKGWKYEFNEEKGYFNFGTLSHGKLKNIKYIINVGADSFSMSAVYPLAAELQNKEMTNQIAEYMHRVNCWKILGHFELDYSDGAIRYYNTILTKGIVPPYEMIEIMFEDAFFTKEVFTDGFLNIIFGGMGAAEAEERAKEKVLELCIEDADRTTSEYIS